MKDKKDAITPDGNFANFMMVLVAAPVVMAWVGLSIFLVAMAFNRPEVVQDIESYKSEQTRKGTFRNGDDHEEKEVK
mgnify:CR=1 FL=1